MDTVLLLGLRPRLKKEWKVLVMAMRASKEWRISIRDLSFTIMKNGCKGNLLTTWISVSVCLLWFANTVQLKNKAKCFVVWKSGQNKQSTKVLVLPACDHLTYVVYCQWHELEQKWCRARSVAATDRINMRNFRDAVGHSTSKRSLQCPKRRCCTLQCAYLQSE